MPSPEELIALLLRAQELAEMQRAGQHVSPLQGKTLAMIFQKPSLRTRVSFETAAPVETRLSGSILSISAARWLRIGSHPSQYSSALVLIF